MVRSSDSRYAAAGTAPLAWADEKRGVLANFEADDSALSVARRFCSGGRRDRPPWPPLLKGGKLRATFAAGNLPPYSVRFLLATLALG